MAVVRCLSSLPFLPSQPIERRVVVGSKAPTVAGGPSASIGNKDQRARLPTNPKVLAKEDLHAVETDTEDIGILSVHHVGILCENLEKSLDFYQNLLGLKINEARPNEKLPYRGAWLWVGDEMIHLMELPNPDPLTGRPEHGGRDRHTCLAIKNVAKLKDIFDKAGCNMLS